MIETPLGYIGSRLPDGAFSCLLCHRDNARRSKPLGGGVAGLGAHIRHWHGTNVLAEWNGARLRGVHFEGFLPRPLLVIARERE